MSNPENQFKQGFTYQQFLDLWGDILQGKVDKRGGAVEGPASNQRVAATWGNLIDDLMHAVADGTVGGGSSTFEYVHNTAAPVAIPSIALASTHDFQVDVVTAFNMLELLWCTITRQAQGSFPMPDMKLEISRTANMDELISVTEFPQDGLPNWNDACSYTANTLMVGPFGLALDEPVGGTRRFYCRLSNVGSVASTACFFSYTVRAFNLALTALEEFPAPPA